MALPSGLMSCLFKGRWIRPSGVPHQGDVFITPDPASIRATVDGVPFVVSLSTTKMTVTADGSGEVTVLNPNDPNIDPGPATMSGATWRYCVEEQFANSNWVKYWVLVPESVGDEGVVDLAKVTRENMAVTRPIDWFPAHKWDARFAYSGISGTT